MPDVLTHVLWGYIIGTVLSLRYEWLDARFVTIVMLGALLPDGTKIRLVLDSALVEHVLGIPFDWAAVHRLGGVVVASTIGALLVGSGDRKRVFTLLIVGAASHLCLDGLLINPSGYSYAIFWPVSTYQFPTPNLLLSSDRWPAVVSGVIALLLLVYTRRLS